MVVAASVTTAQTAARRGKRALVRADIPNESPVRESFWAAAMVACLLVAIWAAKIGGSLWPASTVGVVLALTSFRHWRRGLLAALLFLEVGDWSANYLDVAVLPFFFKDLFFIFPAMLGYFLGGTFRYGALKRFPWAPAMVFTGIILVECLNPQLISPLIALLGIKIWLGYVPLFFLGAEWVRSRSELKATLWTLLLASLPASIYGLYQFKLGQSGDLATGSRPGEFAGGYVATSFDSGTFRLSSLFPSSTQFDYHLLFALMVGVAVLILEKKSTWRAITYALVALILVNVGLTGTRKLYLIVPSSLLWFALLEKNLMTRFKVVFLAGVGGLTAIGLIGVGLFLRVKSIGEIYDDRRDLALSLFAQAVQRAPFGLGSGMASGPAAHIDPNRVWSETLPSKTVLELGILGLFALVALYGAIAVGGFLWARRCVQPELRSVATIFAIYVATIMLTSVYGWPMDLDPANVNSWLSAGLAAGIPLIASQESEVP